MPRYLLDTNALSALVNDPIGRVAQQLALVGVDAVCTSVICAGELRFGIARVDKPDVRQGVEKVLGHILTLPMEEPVGEIYARLRAGLELSGRPIGSNDFWIASHALHLNCAVVTAKEREFRRVPGLTVENWLA